MSSAPAPEIKVKITGEDTGVSAAIKELSLQLQQLKKTQDDAGGSARKLGDAERGAGASMREAREGARLLSEETGVRLNRGLVSVISRSATLGPLLNAAFPLAAAIGFGEVIAKGTEKLTELIASTFIYTDAMKSQHAAQVLANNEIAKSNEKIKELKKAYELIGVSGSARETILAKRAKEDVDAAIKELDRLKKKQLEVEQPSIGKQLLGGALRTFGIDSSVGLPDVDAAATTKSYQVMVQEKKRDELTEEQRAADKELADQKEAEAKTAAEKAKTLQDQINKARLAQIEAGFANELTLFKAQHGKQDQDNEASYVKGLESTSAYYDRKRELAAAESQKEIDALTAERARVMAAPTKDKAGEIENQTKAASLANEIAVAKINAEKVQQQLVNEGAQKQEELDHKVLEFQSQIAQAQGLKFNQASERIAAEALEMAATLRKAGIAPDQVDAMVAKFKAAATQQAQFSGMKQAGTDATVDLSGEEEDIRLKNISIVAEVKIAELERARVPVLEALAAQMRAAAITPEQIKDADEFSKSVDKIAIAAKNSSVSMQSFEQSASDAIKGDLTTFLGSTIDKAHGVGDAFRQLASSVVASIQKIVAQLLVQILTQKLVQAITGQGQNQGGASSDKMVTASAAMVLGGTEVKKGADDLQGAADTLMASAQMLLTANEAGGASGGGGGDDGGDGGGGGGGGLSSLLSSLFGGGNAAGGLITGPGTGTSDSIPARLSTGEFVVRAAAVREIGVDRLAAMNRGLHVPGISGKSIPRFAEGGLVEGGDGRGGTMDLKLGLGLDHGLVLHHLESKAAGKIILQHIANNPKAAGKALQRGGH